MSRKKFLIQSLGACEKREFDEIVKAYLKEIHDFIRIIITDGKDDIGLDIKVFDLAGQKIQYQLTTQKSQSPIDRKKFEDKLLSDLEKAKKNAEDNYYSRTLFFFYSYTLTNKFIRSFEKKALKDFGITLTIIEANRIAEEAEEYLQLQKAILSTNQNKKIEINDTAFPDKDKNLIFDLVGFGKSSDFKLQIIESYVLQLFYEKKQLTFDEIVLKCQDKFKAKENNIFYEKLIAKLQTSKKITKNKDNGLYILLAQEDKRISELKEQFDIDEKEFLSGIKSVLEKYQQDSILLEYVIELKKVYVNNFNSDILEVINNISTSDLSGLSRDFVNFINKHLSTEHNSKELAVSLFKFCQENMFLQKFCAGKVFSETTNLNKIEKYVNTKKRVFIDTQIALYSLCYFYRQDTITTNHYFQITKLLLRFCKKNNIQLYIPENYIWEAKDHLRDALNLIPFTRLSNFQKLGKSRNVFFNYYLDILNNHDKELKYSDFFVKFGFKLYDKYTIHNALIEKYLENVGIAKQKVEKNYDIEGTKKIIQAELVVTNKFKTKFGLNNDSIILDFLSDNDSVVHPLQPIFLSWDKVFFKIQAEYFRRNPVSQRWFLLTPEDFIDQYSLLQFSIDSEVLTSEIIALLSDEIIQSTHSLLDSISFILNPNNDVGLEYVNRFADIRDNEIHRIKDQKIRLPEEIEGEAVIDEVFYKLTKHYYQEDNKLEDFKNLFTIKELMDSIVKVIETTINFVYEFKKFNDNIFSEFDDLINKSKELPK